MKINKYLRNKLKKQLIDQIRTPGGREVEIKTVFKMDNAELKELKESLPQLADAKISNTIDKTILGGAIIIDGSKIIDYSLRGKMDEIVQRLAEN